MAEQPDEVQLPEVEDTPDDTPGYKPPAKKTLDEIKNLDAEDESLNRYKQTLLAGAANVPDEGGPNVLVKKLSILMKGGPAMELDLTGDLTKFKEKPFIFKEKSHYRVQISFRVQREIVPGLKYFQTSFRKGIRVDKTQFMVGSYGPKAEHHMYQTPEEEVPSGMMLRGTYNVKSKFCDDDKNVILEWEWSFKIDKAFA